MMISDNSTWTKKNEKDLTGNSSHDNFLLILYNYILYKNKGRNVGEGSREVGNRRVT